MLRKYTSFREICKDLNKVRQENTSISKSLQLPNLLQCLQTSKLEIDIIDFSLLHKLSQEMDTSIHIENICKQYPDLAEEKILVQTIKAAKKIQNTISSQLGFISQAMADFAEKNKDADFLQTTLQVQEKINKILKGKYSETETLFLAAPLQNGIHLVSILSFKNLADTAGFVYDYYGIVLTQINYPQGKKLYLNITTSKKLPGTYPLGQEIKTAQEAIKIIENTFYSDGLKVIKFTPSQIKKLVKLKIVQKNKIMIQPTEQLKELALDIFIQLRSIAQDIHYKILKVQEKQIISFEFKKELSDSQLLKIGKIFQLTASELAKLGA